MPVAPVSQIRSIDRWFIDEILPHEMAFMRYAYKLVRSEDEAGDILQDCYAKLLGLSGFSAIANPKGYAMRVIHNLAMARFRKAQIVEFAPLRAASENECQDEAPDSFRVLEGKRQLERVEEAIEALPERCRVALVRRRFEEQTPREIASDLGISISTFEKRLARAVALVARALTPSAPPSEEGEEERGHVLRGKIVF